MSVWTSTREGLSRPTLIQATSRLLTTLLLLPCGPVGATWPGMGVLGIALGACLQFSVPYLSQKHQLGLW